MAVRLDYVLTLVMLLAPTLKSISREEALVKPSRPTTAARSTSREGIFGADFDARSGSSVNIFAAEFYLNDAPIDTLILDQAFTVLDRGEDDVFLSGVFADGTQFDFALNSVNQSFRDFFA